MQSVLVPVVTESFPPFDLGAIFVKTMKTHSAFGWEYTDLSYRAIRAIHSGLNREQKAPKIIHIKESSSHDREEDTDVQLS
jgi:hypothetical protein